MIAPEVRPPSGRLGLGPQKAVTTAIDVKQNAVSD